QGWTSHGDRCRAFIERAAALTTKKGLAVVLGVGSAFDLPLPELAQSFETLVLIDVDERTLEATARGLIQLPGLRARIETRVMDLTGINVSMVRAIDELAVGAKNLVEGQARIESLARSYGLKEIPVVLRAGERADLVVSSCVVSQLAWPQRTYAHRVLEQ